MTRDINEIFIHVADTPASMDIGAKEIRVWHTKERGWSDIGYHRVLRRNGVWENGRAVERKGAHASGHNSSSLGLCIVGRGFNISPEQWTSLKGEIDRLHKEYPRATVRGHNEVAEYKHWCPGFDVQGWLKETFDWTNPK